MMVRRRVRATALPVVALLAIGSVVASGEAARPSMQSRPAARPKLVVLLIVDQMRGDYLESYGGLFTGGFRRLMQEGAWFQRGAYPYLSTVTCAGHSTIGTGSFPYRHGMIQNAWFDRATGTSPTCTEDPSVQEISYNGLTGIGDSAARMLIKTIPEQIRERTHGRSVALSLKPRSSVPLAGHAADIVLWFDDRGGWATSSVFSPTPVPVVQRFIDANPNASDIGKTWTRTLPAASYHHQDDAPSERPPPGWTTTFPHAVGIKGGQPDLAFVGQWQRTPLADEYLARMATAIVDDWKLGRGKGTDVLSVSFSTLDLVGHGFGPRSHEVQDVLVRLDLTIGRLMQGLDERVGRANYVLGLSADHGVAEIPEQIGGGRQTNQQTAEALQRALTLALGPGKHVASAAYTDIYFAPAARDRLVRDPALMKVALKALEATPAVERAFRASELGSVAARSSSDRVLRAAALGYHPARSGDVIIVPRENWLLSASATTHGTHQAYDQRVPVIIFGRGVKAGAYKQAATPADIAPTLAFLASVPIGATDGRILKDALATTPITRKRR
jgi:predicted AlkP superfamily pyrophosphatase or phosphodiesterase